MAHGSSGWKSLAAAFSTGSRSSSLTRPPPLRKYSRKEDPVGAFSGITARRTTSVNDSPPRFAARYFSYASISSVMVLIGMHEKHTKQLNWQTIGKK
jgi:hypothetical protein